MIKLTLDRDQIDQCRELSEKIVHPIQKYIDLHSSIAVERSVIRLLGMNGSNENGLPYPNLILEKLDRRKLSQGIATWIGAAKLKFPRLGGQKLAQKIADGSIDLNRFQEPPNEKVKSALKSWVQEGVRQVESARKRNDKIRFRNKARLNPVTSIQIGSGNIEEDQRQAISLANSGSDIISLLRVSGQSLLESVPDGLTTDFQKGTPFTQSNINALAKELEAYGKENKTYVGLKVDTTGLCSPELAAISSFEGVGYAKSCAFYGPLFRDINIKRNLIDQFFSRRILAKAGVVINTSENHYLNFLDAYEYSPYVLASHFINEQFAKNANIKEDAIGLQHAAEYDPQEEDHLLYQIAMAQLLRDIFPRQPLKLTAPTRFKNQDSAYGDALNHSFYLIGLLTRQPHLELGFASGAQPAGFHEFFQTFKNFYFFQKGLSSVYDEINYTDNGKITRSARTILETCFELMKKIMEVGFFESFEQGIFLGKKRFKDDGIGFDGVFQKDRRYYNPFLDLL